MEVKWSIRRFFDNLLVILEMKERFEIGRKLNRSSLLSEGFFNSGLIIDDFKVEGKVPVVMERFTSEWIIAFMQQNIALQER